MSNEITPITFFLRDGGGTAAVHRNEQCTEVAEHCAHSEAKPLLVRVKGSLGWEYLASNPARYWFRCTSCGDAFTCTWLLAAAKGYVEVVDP
jgi:hypothetical protein